MSSLAPTLPRFLKVFAARPRLVSGFVVGLVAFLVSAFFSAVQRSTLAICAWDVTCLWFIALTLQHMRRQSLPDLKAHVAADDEGQNLIVVFVMTAVTASLFAIGIELSLAKDAHGLEKECRVALALTTTALSWFITQLIFALHYAHMYYAPDLSTPEEDDVIGGLNFPGGKEPDIWDFLHFAIVIGVASQTADISFTGKRLRRTGTVHSVISFTFNTAVLALSINLLAGLF